MSTAARAALLPRRPLAAAPSVERHSEQGDAAWGCSGSGVPNILRTT